MATHPHHDDDQAKKPDEAPKTPVKPKAPPTPKPVIPNMSLDEPGKKPLEVSDVIDDDVVEAAPVSDVAPMVLSADDAAEAQPVSDVLAAEEVAEPIEEATPVSDVAFAEEVIEDAAPVSDVAVAEEVVEDAAPVSDVAVAEEVIEEASPVSDVAVAEEVIDAAPASGAVHTAPASEVVTAAETAHAAPASEVLAASEVAHAAPASEVVAASDAVHVAPASAVRSTSGVGAAAPASEVIAAEEVVEEAAPASDVLFDDEIAEAVPASEARSGEVIEEAVEAIEEPSSATRRSEAVIEDEDAEEIVEAVEEASSATRRAESVLDEDGAEAEEVVSAVEETEFIEPGSGARKRKGDVEKTASFDKTMAFDQPASAKKKKKSGDSDLVTEEEVGDVSEGSSVNLGDVPAKKGSSVSGIDKVAEALESGVEASELAETTPPTPSVEFDDLLDEDIAVPAAKKGKKDAEAPKKKGKAEAKGTGEDIDLDAIFDDDEATEAVEAEEAEAVEAVDAEEATEAVEALDAEEAEEAVEAEEAQDATAAYDADEAFDEEMEAAEAVEEDEAPAKKKPKAGKKTRASEDEDEDAAEEEEETSARKKKKDKKGKRELAMTAPAAAPGRPSTFLRIFIGMFLATIGIAGAAAAGWYFAPDHVMDLAKQSPRYEPPKKDTPTTTKKDKDKDKETPDKSKFELASLALAEGKYDDVKTQLVNASEPNEKALRGEAKWLAYVKEQAKKPYDPEDARVKDARKDLELVKNNPFLEQMDVALSTSLKLKEIDEHLAKLKMVENNLLAAKADKKQAERLVDAVAETLLKGEYIKNKGDLIDAVVLKKLMNELPADKATLTAVNKLLKDNDFKAADKDGLKDLVKKYKEADDSFSAVKKVLDDEKIKDEGAKGVLAIIDVRNKLKKDRDELDAAIIASFKELVDGKIVPDSPEPRAKILDGVKLARQKAESPLAIPLGQLGMSLGGIGSGTGKVVEQSFDLAKVFTELGFFRTREPFIETPEQKMNTYITLLQDRKQNNPKRLADISREADWVLDPESKTDKESHGKARYVQGLALRNEEKFPAARTAFAEALKMAPKAGPWLKLAAQSHRELVDSTAYFVPRVAAFQAEGNLKAAEDEATLALKAIPDDARLLAQRGLIRYEQVRGKGAKVPDGAQKDIRADAKAAEADEKFAAESAYVVGLLEEELGNLTEAEKLYRQALKAHAGADDEAGKYRVALARLLLRERTGDVPAEEKKIDEKKKDDEKKVDEKKKDDKKIDEKKVDEKKKDEKKIDEDKKGGEKKKDAGAAFSPGRVIVLHPWTPLVVSAVIAQPVEDIEDPATLARLNETIKLAHELIASKNDKIKGQGYVLLGSALSKLGKRTEGLKEFSKGLKLIYPGIETKELDQLIDEHPAFRQPDSSNTPNPIMAERHFGEGIHHYWAKEYTQAETQFRQSIKYYDKDARFQYYLGLSQLMQKTKLKRDAAYYSFEKGARLEAKIVSSDPFAARQINTSLERIQGDVRQLLNDFRYKAHEEKEDKDAK